MVKLHAMVRLSAKETGETPCVIFVNSVTEARERLKSFSASLIAEYPFIGAFGAEVFAHRLSDLAALPCVKAIAPRTVCTVGMKSANAAIGVSSVRPLAGFGSNISVAVIDTGVRPHLDFCVPQDRIVFRDFVQGESAPYDDNGHGTAVASILCGNGLISGGDYAGVAPKAKLYALKAIGQSGESGAFAILDAMQWVYDNAEHENIRVVCMSFGSVPVVGGVDPLSVGAEALWKKGIVVVASAGNDGPGAKTIKSPGCNPHIVTVGAARVSELGITIPDFSSRGPAGRFLKPDLVAPGVSVTAAGIRHAYESFTGTSMAAPMVAGAAALILSRRPDYSPNRVKELLLNSALSLPFTPESAGRGLLSFSFLDDLAD